MAFCENCGSEIKKGQKFCENCGALVNDSEAIEVPYVENKNKSGDGENHFCENCGAVLEAGADFCENCGTKVIKTTKICNLKSDDDCMSDDWSTLFKNNNWSNRWLSTVVEAHNKGKDCGIILTNSKLLLNGFDDSLDEFYDSLKRFIDAAYEKNNVKYYFLDTDDNKNAVSRNTPDTINEEISLLKKVVNVARPKYLFILGGTETLPRITWESRCCDGDEYLDSDLVYSTLDENTPFEGQNYNFDDVLRVGRLPQIPNTNFSKILDNYTENMKCNIEDIQPFGVTAYQWEDTSKYVYHRFSDGIAKNSPNFILDNFEKSITGSENLLYFNVHGSSSTQFWYGQNGGSYPEASEPISFENFRTPFILGVEACYGGKFSDVGEKEYSTVYSAFYNKCVSMLASTYIAYGTPCGPGASADILIGKYLQNMKEGYSAGDAYVNGLKELSEKDEYMNDMSIKTMIEFALYGDPSYRRSKNIEKKSFSLKKAFGGVAKGLKVPMPDVRRAVSMSLTDVDAKIAAPIKNHVVGKYAGFEESNPIFYKYDNSKYTQATFQKSTDFGQSYVKICFDDKGKIVRELVSK